MKPVWLVAAVALAAFLWWRRRRLEPPVLIAGVIAVVAAAVYSTGLVHVPSLDKILEDIGSALGPWTYGLVALLAFLEAGAFIGLLIPGETALIVAGVVAGQGQINIVLLIAIAWTFAVLGDLTGYALGRRLGRPFLVRHGPRFGISEERVTRSTRSSPSTAARRSSSAASSDSSGRSPRSWPLLRDAAAAVGSLRRARRRTPVLVPCLIGYVFWHSLDRVLAIAKQGALALSAGRSWCSSRDRRRRALAAAGREPGSGSRRAVRRAR